MRHSLLDFPKIVEPPQTDERKRTEPRPLIGRITKVDWYIYHIDHIKIRGHIFRPEMTNRVAWFHSTASGELRDEQRLFLFEQMTVP